MLIYLDTSHIAWLEQAKSTPARRFVDAWSRCGCKLIISPMHLQEIGQLASDASIRRRMDIIQNLAPVCVIDPPTSVFEFEIRNLLRSAVNLEKFRTTDYRVLHLHAVDIPGLASAISEHQWAIEEMRRGLKLAAEGEILSKQTEPPRADKVDVHELPDRIRLARDLVASIAPTGTPVREQFDKVLTSLEESVKLGKGSDDLIREMLGLSQFSHAAGVPRDDLSGLAYFLFLARGICRPFMGSLPNDLRRPCEEIIKALDPYSCPGYRLKLAVYRARHMHPKAPEPGDQIDEEHIVYAPYLDMLFVDKRTFGFAKQETERPHGLLLSVDLEHLRKAGSLDTIGSAILEEYKRRI